MDLLLWRHAEAADGTPDQARSLTSKGIRQAEKIATFLRPQLPDSYRLLVSPAKRTIQTASALSEHFLVSQAIATGTTAQQVLLAANWPDEEEPVLIVGHQPTLGEVAALLLGCNGSSLNIKKGSVWWFNQRKHDGEDRITLRLVISPDFL